MRSWRDEREAMAARAGSPPPAPFGRESLDRLWAVDQELRRRHGVLSDSVPVIRAARDRER